MSIGFVAFSPAIADLHTFARVDPGARKSIVRAVLIYNTIKTHGKTVDAILVIN